MVINPMSFKFLEKLSYEEKLKFYCSIFNVDMDNLFKYFNAVIMAIGLPFSSIVSREIVSDINTEYKLIFIIVLAIFLYSALYLVILNTICRWFIWNKFKKYNGGK